MTTATPMPLDISKVSEIGTVRTPQPDLNGRSTPSPDSGYASTTTTPNSTPQCAQGEQKFPTGKLFKRKIRLKVFEEEIPTHVRDRFLDLQELFDRPLYERLVSSGKKFRPISSKLKRLGESEQTSAYWLVVQCEPKIARRVRQFFDQDHVKSEYQPSNDSEDLPWFNIWVCPEPPIRLAKDCEVDEGIFLDLKERTLCGTLVKVQGRIATIGGVIMVKAQEEKSLYCLTAGHIISTASSLAGVRDARDEEEQDLSDVESEDSLSDDFTLDSSPGDNSRKGQTLGISKTDFLQPSAVRFVEGTQRKTKRCFDWALATLNEADLYRPNCRMRANSDDEDGVAVTTVELRETDRRSTRLAVSRRVVVLGGVSGSKFGILSRSPSSYMSAPATSFAQMYTLIPTAGSGETDFENANKEDANTLTALEIGDCGSWIVDEATNEVYGHVVASDIFGEVYVAPLKETLKQIEEVLGADSVSLPTRSEVAAWIEVYTAHVAIGSWTFAAQLEGDILPASPQELGDNQILLDSAPDFASDSAYGSHVHTPSLRPVPTQGGPRAAVLIPKFSSSLESGLEQNNYIWRFTNQHPTRAEHLENALYKNHGSSGLYHGQVETTLSDIFIYSKQTPPPPPLPYYKEYSQVKATMADRENMIHSQKEHRAVGLECNRLMYSQSSTATYHGFPQSYQEYGNSPDDNPFGMEPNIPQPSFPLTSTASSHPSKLLTKRASSTKEVRSCSYCNEKFNNISNLQRHIRYVHLRYLKYSCPEECGHESTRPDNLSKHCDKIHGSNWRLKGNRGKPRKY